MNYPLTLDALAVIEAIERKGSYAAAATALNRVPSAVSYTVQKLEQDLGVTLFQREGRRAVLTSAGRHLAEQGRQLLEAAEDLAASTRQISSGWEPRLRVALDTIVPAELVLRCIGSLQRQHPGIEVVLTHEVLGGTWEALIENRVDLVVGAVGNAPGHHGVRCEPWLEFEHIFVAAPEHPVCALPQPLATAALSQFRAVIVSDTARNSSPLSRGLLQLQSAIYVPSMAAKIEAHRQGLGVGYVPHEQVKADLETGRLQRIKLAETREDESSMLGWKVSNQGKALHYLLQQLRDLRN
jgi:DNA-binding transcriptional LysR family regulator